MHDQFNESGRKRGLYRREWLHLLGVGGAAGMAGCIGDDEGATEEETDVDDDETDDRTPEPDADRRVHDEYVSAMSSDGETLNPTYIVDTTSNAFVNLTMDGAYVLKPDNEVFPLWCDIDSDDGRVYEVELRDNLNWGDPYGQMTAEDWVYYIHEVHQAEGNPMGSVDREDWMSGDEPIEVEKTGRLTFEIRLPDVDPAYPMKTPMWGTYTLPRDLVEPYVEEEDVEGFQEDEEVLNLSFTGNLGPYEFERWDRESEFVATRNEDYYMRDVDDVPEEWQEAPYFEEYTYNVIPEESTRLSALRSGEVSTASIPLPRTEQFADEDNVDVVQVPQSYLNPMAYNQRKVGWDPLRIKEVRQALSHAVNKRVITDHIQRGYSEVAQTFQPRWSDWYDDSEVTEYGVGDSHDYELARELLEENLPSDWGYDGDEVLGPEGRQVTLDFIYGAGADTTETIAEHIANEYAEIGIDVNLEPMQFNTMLERVFQNEWVGDDDPPWTAGPYNQGPRDQTESEEEWDLTMLDGGYNTYPRTPSETDTFWELRGALNFYGYESEYDIAEKYGEASKTVDEDERQAIYAEIFGILSEEQPVNFLDLPDSVIGYQDYVRGPEPVFGYGWNANTWYFDADEY